MSAPPPMSTPIQSLPHPTAVQPIDDPEINSVLREMESENSSMHSAPPSIHAPTYAPQPMMQPSYAPLRPQFLPVESPSLWNIELAKRAMIAAILAAALFHPALMQLFIKRVPALEYNELYQTGVRVLLLGVALYVLMIKLDL